MYTRSKTIFIKGMKSKFMERSRIVFLGVVISQLITFATSFVITGYYNPEDLGLLGTIGALISIVAGTLSFKLDVAVIQAKEEDTTDIFLKSTILGMLACAIFSFVCLFLPWDFAKKISEFFIPFVLWCWGYCFFFNSKQLPFKFNHLKNVSYGVIWKSAFTFVFQLLAGILKPSFGLLLTGRVSGDYVGGIAHCWKYFKEFDFKRLKSGWNKFFSTHADFLFYMTPHHLCIALSNNIIIFYLERGYGLAVVGFFALAQRLIQAPLELIGSTLFNVTVQRFGELQHNIQELRRFYLKVIFFSFAVSVIIGIGIWGTIDIFIPILGAKWAPAAPMVKNLVPYFMSTIFVTPTTNFLRFVNKAKIQLIFEMIEVTIKIGFLSVVSFSESGEIILGYSLLAFGLGILKTGLVLRLIRDIK